jgi:membrane protein YdbS with pleckstrin-like domain
MTSDGAVEWRQLPVGLRRLRRTLLVAVLAPVTLLVAVVLGAAAGPLAALGAAVPAAVLAGGWVLVGRSWRSWRYALREDDVLLSHGVMWHEQTIVPYGRMQLIEVTSGPLERRFGLASLQLHTAAAATDASIPGLTPADAVELRDRLAELGEARAAGL